MQTKSQVMFRVLLNRFAKGREQALLKHLSEKDLETLKQMDIASNSPEKTFTFSNEQIQKIHYSWLKEALEKCPKEYLPYTFSLLKKNQLKGICELLSVEEEQKSCSRFMESFISWRLANKLGITHRIPLDYIQSPLSSLLQLSKIELIDIIDYLGLHDLSQEIRQIVDKQKLKQIFETLNQNSQLYLRTIMHQPDKLISPKFLKETTLRTEELRKWVHRRGIYRLAKALKSESSDFLWYITHTLDTGRASLIEKYMQEEESAKVIEFLHLQIQQIMQFISERNQ